MCLDGAVSAPTGTIRTATEKHAASFSIFDPGTPGTRSEKGARASRDCSMGLGAVTSLF